MSEIVLASEASDQDAWLGVATNISLGGAYIETSAPASFGDRVRLRMPLPGLSEPAQIECVVRWCSADGVGLQFGAMGAKETHGLTALIAKSQTSAPSEPGEPAP